MLKTKIDTLSNLNDPTGEESPRQPSSSSPCSSHGGANGGAGTSFLPARSMEGAHREHGSEATLGPIDARRMIAAANFIETLKTLPLGNVLPQAEAQVRPLLRLYDSEHQATVWATAMEQADGGSPRPPRQSTPFSLPRPNPNRNALRFWRERPDTARSPQLKKESQKGENSPCTLRPTSLARARSPGTHRRPTSLGNSSPGPSSLNPRRSGRGCELREILRARCPSW